MRIFIRRFVSGKTVSSGKATRSEDVTAASVIAHLLWTAFITNKLSLERYGNEIFENDCCSVSCGFRVFQHPGGDLADQGRSG
uniref:Uncharacterized protein n=1 Tax=Serratia sp. SES-01 TaxID=497914 RepID=B0M0H7_9GAMM|nr:hypothetical protein [Serratia sp. SES-01]